MRLAWLTDIHLDTVSGRKLKTLGRRLQEEVEGIIITGDIADGRTVKYLWRLRRFFTGKIFFCCGNHDFYGGWIEDKEEELRRHNIPNAFYLTRAQPIYLSPTVGLVGDDGWYDGRNGIIDFSRFGLRDFHQVFDVRKAHAKAVTAPPSVRALLFQEDLAAIADRAVSRLRPKLEEAASKFKTVIVATHFPPFPAAAEYQGECDPYAMPYYSSKAMGDLLYRVAVENPEVEFVALCGHVHADNAFVPVDNLEVFSGVADYTRLFINRILEIGETVKFFTPDVQEVAPTPKRLEGQAV